jgi:hypothetical protein
MSLRIAVSRPGMRLHQIVDGQRTKVDWERGCDRAIFCSIPFCEYRHYLSLIPRLILTKTN